MPRRLCSIAVAALLVLTAAPGFAKVTKGDRASEFSSVKDKRNKKLKLRQYRGKVVVLTFGASWCKPCKKELPAYEKLAKKFRKSKSNVEFIAINIDSERENADDFVKKAGVKVVRVGYDPSGNSADKYEPPTMPTTYIIDQKGIVREVHRGFESGDEKTVEKLVKKLL
jgi:thiol-disulfide isomerase/thioredoxin